MCKQRINTRDDKQIVTTKFNKSLKKVILSDRLYGGPPLIKAAANAAFSDMAISLAAYSIWSPEKTAPSL